MLFSKRFSGMAAIAGIALTLSLSSALSQDVGQSHLDAALKAVSATQSSNRFDNILPGLADQAKAELIRNMPDKDAAISDIVDTVALELAPRRADLETEIGQIFARVFNEDELGQVSEFFNSDIGRKFLTESPVLLRETDRAARVWSNGLQRDMAEKVGEKLKEAGLQ